MSKVTTIDIRKIFEYCLDYVRQTYVTGTNDECVIPDLSETQFRDIVYEVFQGDCLDLGIPESEIEAKWLEYGPDVRLEA